MTKRRVHLLYPSDHWVEEDRIESWFWDAVADGEIRPSDWFDHTPTIEAMIAALSDLGAITVAEEQNK